VERSAPEEAFRLAEKTLGTERGKAKTVSAVGIPLSDAPSVNNKLSETGVIDVDR
jgi:hypothetical protein